MSETSRSAKGQGTQGFDVFSLYRNHVKGVTSEGDLHEVSDVVRGCGGRRITICQDCKTLPTIQVVLNCTKVLGM